MVHIADDRCLEIIPARQPVVGRPNQQERLVSGGSEVGRPNLTWHGLMSFDRHAGHPGDRWFHHACSGGLFPPCKA